MQQTKLNILTAEGDASVPLLCDWLSDDTTVQLYINPNCTLNITTENNDR